MKLKYLDIDFTQYILKSEILHTINRSFDVLKQAPVESLHVGGCGEKEEEHACWVDLWVEQREKQHIVE